MQRSPTVPLLLGVALTLACEEGPPPAPAPPAAAAPAAAAPADGPVDLAPTFANVHTHVLARGCASPGCHDAAAASGGLDLSTAGAAYAGLVDQPATNPVAAENRWIRVRPGDPDRSFLLRKLAGPGLGEGDPMPAPSLVLAPGWLNLVRAWIAAGAPPPAGPAEPGPVPELLTTRDERTLRFQDPMRACISCHPTHVRDWSISNHAYAVKDPVFLAMVRLGQRQTEGKMGQFCVQCHTPAGLATGQTPVLQAADGTWYQKLDDLDPVAQQGLTCDVCHSVTAVNEPRNARMVFTPDGTMRATIEDPVDTDAHRSAYSPLHATSDLCGSCHNVTNGAGALIEETYDEWAKSDFARPGGKTCQDCHMPAYTGRAAVDGPIREVHRHTFVGVDVSLLPPDQFPGYDEMRELTASMLRDAALLGVEIRPADRRLTVRVENLAGHRLPSGATAERQMWLEVLVHDDQRTLRFASGTLDARGDLRDDFEKHTLAPGTDPQLQVWRQILLRDGEAVDFPWQANDVHNRLIEPGATETVTYDLTALPPGQYTLQVRLLFRTFPPYFLRELETEAGLDPAVKHRVPVVEMSRAGVTLMLGGEPPTPGPCDAHQILDCNATCQPRSWLGDGRCEDGRYSDWGAAHFACAELGYDDGDCPAPPVDPACPAGEVTDCVGACWPWEWLADGWCDDGTAQDWGDPDFRCAAHDWDAGDCPDPTAARPDAPVDSDARTAEGCLVDFVRDCADVCHPAVWLGDGNCDDGTNADWGNPDFSCAAFAADRGDCR